mgnify:FL=1
MYGMAPNSAKRHHQEAAHHKIGDTEQPYHGYYNCVSKRYQQSRDFIVWQS